MPSKASGDFGFSPTQNRRLRCCASINNFTARSRSSPPPLLTGETGLCEDDGYETQIENLEGETQVLVGEGEVCDIDLARMVNLEGDTQVVDRLDDGCEMSVVSCEGETQVWDAYGGETQVDDAVYDLETQWVNLGGETEVQDDEDCVRNVCSQFLRNGIDSIESGTVKDVFLDIKTNLVDEIKQGHSYRKPVEKNSETFSATPPRCVEADPGSFQRSFTSIRAASLRASGLAARCKTLVETRNNSCHASVGKENEISCVAHSPLSTHNHDIAEQEVKYDVSMCKTMSSVVNGLLTEEVLADNRKSSNESNGEGTKTPLLPLTDDNDEVAGLSYVDSQEPGDSTQGDALDFIERFVKDNASDMQLEADNEPLRRTISKPASCAKGFLNFPKKAIILRQPVDQAVSFNWDEEIEDEGGGDFFCRMKEKILNESGHKQRSLPQPQKSRRCSKFFGDKRGKMKSYDKSTAVQSDSKLILLNSNRKGKVLGTAEASTRRNLEAELNEDFLDRCTEAAACRSEIQETFSVGPDTQMAAEAMEALFCGEPISGGDVNANQGNFASISSVAGSKSILATKMLDSKKKSTSDGLGSRKSKRTLNGKKKGHIHGTRKRNGEEEVDGTCTVEKKERANDRVSPRTTRSMVLNQRSMLSNQANMAISKDKNSEIDFLVGVGIPKGKRSRKCVGTYGSRHQSIVKDKFDRAYSDAGEVKLDEPVIHEMSRSNVKTLGAESHSRSQSTSRDPSRQLVKSRDHSKQKSTKDGNKGSLHLSCDEGSAAKRSVAYSAGAFCSLDAANIYRDVSHKDLPDHHSAKGTGVNTADCGMPVETFVTVPRRDRLRKSCEPSESSCITPDNHSKISNARVVNSCRRQLPINLSRSSLRKELSALLSNSSKALSELKRKRREMNEVRILFSNHLDDDVIKHQKKILARLGASLAFSISDATHFVTDSFVRTMNMLEAIALGKPVVTHLWLESCNQTSCLIDEKAYILRDAKKEKELGFSMPDTLFRASQHPLLQNRKVIITPNSKPSKDIVAKLVKAVHGWVVENFDTSSLKVDKYPDNVLILSCEEDYLFCQPFLDEGVKVYSSELLLGGIVTQRLDYARHRLFEDHVRTAVSRRLRSTRGCRI
ncbi:unnamed protein product [Rhodiola kirilowii]